jgi:hypothetical protein
LRGRAAERLQGAVELDVILRERRWSVPAYVLDDALAEAAQWEWIAQRAELGEVLWGGRFNRCGFQPLTDE